jgi:PKHD-type hydroxylase|tara:strand:- start:542 stop:1120 length:579 start_codon:yes stop_codon:yes gene_type:complete
MISPIWPFEADKVHHYAYADNVLTKKECEDLVFFAKSMDPEEAFVGKDKKLNHNIRKNKVRWLTPHNEIQDVYRKITDAIVSLNKDFFNFKLYGIYESLQFTTYGKDEKYTKHTDRLFSSVIRKLSFSIQLTDPKEYDGGDLVLYDADTQTKMNREQGTIIVFPSFIPHEVQPVTKGERDALVGWITGSNFN